MRGFWLVTASCLLGNGMHTLHAQGTDSNPARGAASQRADDTRMLQLLSQWETVSRAHDTLYAQFTRTDRSPAWPDAKVFEGKALLRKPNLACLEFKERVAGQENPVFNQRIVCSGEKVYQFLGPTKQVFVYPLAADERRRAIEEGPLPFLFNMRVDRALERYSWKLLQERRATATKAAVYIVEIVPRQAIDLEEFSRALVMLNQETFLPEALQLFAPNGKDTKTFIFEQVERNGEKNPAGNLAYYDGEKMARKFQDYGYKVIVNPDATDQPRRVGQAPPAPAQPSTRRR